MRARPSSLRAGFNLIEVLIALAILAAVFVPVFSLFQSGVRATKSSEDRMRALNVALQQIEAVRHAASINKESLEQVVVQHLVDNGGQFPVYTVDERYTVETEVDPDFQVDEGGVQATVTRVKVIVTWKLNKDDRRLALETFLDRAYE